jgi:hypothetical protein
MTPGGVRVSGATMSRSRTSDMGAASAALAIRWPVFPCAGKVPCTRNGLLDATSDPLVVERWWQRVWPGANVAVRTGNGLVVLDVDGDDGAESLRALERRHGELPPTVSVVTGGGGQHFYFTCSAPVRNSAGRLGSGLDIRGDGGYVIAPPSVHASGRAYEWDNDPDDVELASLPAWLLEPVAGVRKRTPPGEWVRMLQGIPSGERNHSLARLTGYLLHRDVEPRVALQLMLAVNRAACRPALDDDEVVRVVESIACIHLRS